MRIGIGTPINQRTPQPQAPVSLLRGAGFRPNVSARPAWLRGSLLEIDELVASMGAAVNKGPRAGSERQ